VLTPITSPRELTSGPPELPGLSAASVWMTSPIRRPFWARSERPTALTMPAVTVDSKPSGLPMAMAICPGLILLELPSRAAGSRFGGLRAQHGDVGVGVAPQHARGKAPVVGKRQLDGRGGALHHVVVGEHDAVGRKNGAGARALGLAALA